MLDGKYPRFGAFFVADEPRNIFVDVTHDATDLVVLVAELVRKEVVVHFDVAIGKLVFADHVVEDLPLEEEYKVL